MTLSNLNSLPVNMGFAWKVSIDEEEYGVETNEPNESQAVRESIIARTGARNWSASSFSKYRLEHNIVIVAGPIHLNRRAICSDNENFD